MAGRTPMLAALRGAGIIWRCQNTAALLVDRPYNADAVPGRSWMSAAETYAARIDAVLAQRTRLRGPEPAGFRYSQPPDHPLMKVDARRPMEPNLAVIASYVEPDDVIVDVGGGAGRLSLPLALHCREVINVDSSDSMLDGFAANAERAGITNARAVHASWLDADPPAGSFGMVNHVTYFAREIVPFVEKLERAASRRVLITVGTPQPPSWNRELFPRIYGEPEAIVPGHVELVNVLWEMGILPDVRILPDVPVQYAPVPTREAAVEAAFVRFVGEQWARWPVTAELEARIRQALETGFDELFIQSADGFRPGWIDPGREVLITWEPRHP
jgi:SAM-dependent methyltransferase